MSGYFKEEKQKNVKSYHVPGFVYHLNIKARRTLAFYDILQPRLPPVQKPELPFLLSLLFFSVSGKAFSRKTQSPICWCNERQEQTSVLAILSASFPTTMFTVNDLFKLYTFLSGLVPWVSTLNSSSHSTPTPVRIKIANTFLRGQRGLIAVVNSEQFSY